MSSLQPRDARTAYLNGHSPEKAAAIVLKADSVGPSRDDADWLVAHAAAEAAQRIEAVAPATEKTLAAFAERLERVEQVADDILQRLKAPVARPPVPAISVEVSDQLDRMEARLRSIDTEFDELSPLTVHGVAIAIVIAAFAVGYMVRVVNPVTTILVVLLVAALAYAYLGPLLEPSLARALRRLRR